MKGLTHFSLCSGIGGLDLAAEWAGFETIGQCEIDDYASKVLAKNFKGVKNYGDIRTINARLLAGDGIGKGEITVLSAGIPCQPYSLAGKGLGDCDERDLEQELIRVIGELRPRWVVVENTPGLFARKNQQYFDRILNDISEMGYRVGWGMWRACDVGANHERERVFFIAHTDTDCIGCNSNEIFADEFKKSLSSKKKQKIQTCRNKSCRMVRRYDEREIKPGVYRAFNGLPEELDRLRCLGNAVVPQQAYPIFKAIADYEKHFGEE